MKSTCPDYGFWAQHAEVKLYQGVALLCGINPDNVDLFFLTKEPEEDEEPDPSHSTHAPEARRAFRRLFRVATANFPPDGDLPVSSSYQPGTGEDYEVSVLLPKFIYWSVMKGYPVPSELESLAQPIMGPPVGWEGFDVDSQTYPELLDIALNAWRWASKTALEGRTPKQAVLDLLAAHHPGLSKSAQNQIATICNWDKTGGRPTEE